MQLKKIGLVSLLAPILVLGCVKESVVSDFCFRYIPITDVESLMVSEMNRTFACECMELTKEEYKEWCE